MTVRYKNSLRSKILEVVMRLDGAVVLRSDVNGYGGARQVSRALKALVDDGELIKLGYGVYVKSEKNPYNGKPVMVVPMAEACVEALNRLGVRWQPGKAIQDYNNGKTQQVPAKFIVRLKDRFRGQLGAASRKGIIFERGINAR